MKPVCVFVGPPGAGKSTVGEIVAGKLGVPFRDTDAEIVAIAGKPVSDIFIDDGEEHFRALETTALDAVLVGFGGVVALGGGVVIAPQNRAALAGHNVIYLSVGLSDAVKRVGLDTGRPLLSVNPRATLRYMLDQRRPLYEEIAAHTVSTDGRSPDDIANEVVSLLDGGS